MSNELINFDKQFSNKKILGIDEVGRGCCAGPLVVAGVILKPDYFDLRIKDSKKIKSIIQRREIALDIIKNSLFYKVVSFSPIQVDKYNPKRTSILGMTKIAKSLKGHYDLLITDYEKVNLDVEQLNLKKGDQTSYSVAAASIVAKYFRDNEILKMDNKYPKYHFASHHGYVTKKHLESLEKYGPLLKVHRYTYKCIKAK